LLSIGLRQGSWAALDQAIELLLPPFSTLVLLSVGVSGIHLLWSSLRPLFPLSVSIGLAVAWVAFPFCALAVDRAPALVYRALLHSPLYLSWRLWVGLKAHLSGERVRWVRTRRREEVEQHTSEA
jgi:hypothetical protein